MALSTVDGRHFCFSEVLLKANLNCIVLQSLDGRSIRVDEAGKGSRRQSGGQYAGRGGGRFGGGGRGRGGRGHHGGEEMSVGIYFIDVSVIPLLSFAVAALVVEVVDTKGTSAKDTTETVAAAIGATAAAAAAAVATEVAVAAAGDTAVATETIGTGQELNLNHGCCTSFMFWYLMSLFPFCRSQGGYSNERTFRDYDSYGKYHFYAFDFCM